MAILNDRSPVTTPVTTDALFGTAIGAAAATKASFAEMGGLEVDEQTPTGNITGAVGMLYVITTTSMSGNIDVTVPSASVGERMGVLCVTDEPDHEIIIKGAASQTINGGSAATEWSRLFIAGEIVILRCTAANTWWVEHDGRIPSVGILNENEATTPTEQNVNASTTWHAVTWTAGADSGTGDIADQSNGIITPRRDGLYALTCGATVDDIDDTETATIVLAYDKTTADQEIARDGQASGKGGYAQPLGLALVFDFTVSTHIDFFIRVYHTETGNSCVLPDWAPRWLTAVEVL